MNVTIVDEIQSKFALFKKCIFMIKPRFGGNIPKIISTIYSYYFLVKHEYFDAVLRQNNNIFLLFYSKT